MENKKPVELWKGIVGTAVSAFVILLVACVYVPLYFSLQDIPLWVTVWVLIATVVCAFTLVIGIINIREAIAYKRQRSFVKTTQPALKQEDQNKTELLHKLLAEGKITIEEYDELSK